MTLLRVLPALLLSLSLYTSVSHACDDHKACSKDEKGATSCSHKAEAKHDGKTASAESCTDHENCKVKDCECPECAKIRAKKTKTSAVTTEGRVPATANTATTTTTTGTTNYEVTMAEGQMHCGDCAKKVSAALKGLPDVDQGTVKVLLSKNTATLQVKPNSKVTAEQIKKTIEEKTGYTVSKVETLTGTPAAKTTTTTTTTN